MRLKWQRRARKQLRKMRGYQQNLAMKIAKLERQGFPLAEALRVVLLDPAESHFGRGAVGKLLSVSGDDQAVQALLKLFFEQTERVDLYNTALALEELDDRRAVPPLIHALLEDGNPHRRHAAARALGWIRRPGRAAAVALAQCVVDPAQPQPAREEAAESLAYVGTRETIDPLIDVLRDPDVRIRFWAVFGLGGRGHRSARTVQALESMLGDREVPPGNWWSVGKEALAMLANMQPPVADYEARLVAEAQRLLSDPNATVEDRRWAECCGRDENSSGVYPS
jgi:HEAT repeat protein